MLVNIIHYCHFDTAYDVCVDKTSCNIILLKHNLVIYCDFNIHTASQYLAVFVTF